MTLKRTKIRKTIVDLLKSNTEVNDNVFANRAVHQNDDRLPVIHVYTKSESIAELSNAPRSYFRDLAVVIEIIVKDTNAEDGFVTAERICEQVENAIDQEDQDIGGELGCMIEHAILQNVDSGFDIDGDGVLVGVNLTYEVRYHREAGLTPRSDGVDLSTVNVQYRDDLSDLLEIKE